MVRSQGVEAMRIGALAGTAGVSVETVRYYQRRGLLDVPIRSGAGRLGGGTRVYGAEDLRRLRFIRAAQAAGFTLEEIGELIRLDAGHDRARVRAIAAVRIAELDERIAALSTARDALSGLADQCRESDKGPCPILAAFAAPPTSGCHA